MADRCAWSSDDYGASSMLQWARESMRFSDGVSAFPNCLPDF